MLILLHIRRSKLLQVVFARKGKLLSEVINKLKQKRGKRRGIDSNANTNQALH